jgi:hypothetical protein
VVALYHIWQTMQFFSYFGRGKRRYQKGVDMTVRILLVDDHSVVRQGLRLFLKYDPELEVW